MKKKVKIEIELDLDYKGLREHPILNRDFVNWITDSLNKDYYESTPSIVPVLYSRQPWIEECSPDGKLSLKIKEKNKIIKHKIVKFKRNN
jgi:hypothetical protein